MERLYGNSDGISGARSRLPTTIGSKPSAEALAILFAKKKAERATNAALLEHEIELSEDEDDDVDDDEVREPVEIVGGASRIRKATEMDTIGQENVTSGWNRDEKYIRTLAANWAKLIPWKVSCTTCTE